MLSDVDIRQCRGKDIFVEPYDKDDLTPLGYNLNPSDFVYSTTRESLVPEENGYYQIRPNETVLILTKEYVWVSKKIAGTFHSKVGVVSLGFGHISTTLDPGWKGNLLISLNNPTTETLRLPANKSFVTLIFYKVRTPARMEHDNVPSRSDVIKNLIDNVLKKSTGSNLTNDKAAFLIKATSIIENKTAKKKLEDTISDVEKFSGMLNGIIQKNAISFIKNTLLYWILRTSKYFIAIVVTLKMLSYILDAMNNTQFGSFFESAYIQIISPSMFVGLVSSSIALHNATAKLKEEIVLL